MMNTKNQVCDVLVIGGGIAGVQAALDIAEQGIKVWLVESSPSIGGRMAQLDKTFPTNDCSMCILAPKLVTVGRHKNISLLTNSEVINLEGRRGDFKVKIRKKPRYVKDNCIGCGECVKNCPVIMPNEFDVGLGSRKAIYTPFLQSVPSVYIIDMENCLNKNGVIVCKHCLDACDKGSVDFDAKEELVELNAGAIIIATGFEQLAPQIRNEYGYGRFENVLTALEYERLLSASGPTGGIVLRPSDLQKPKKIAFIQCVASRCEQQGYAYCSRVCCMYATKEASITKDSRPDCEIYIFYMDIRAYGKDFQQYYKKAESAGVYYIRGRPSVVYEADNKNIILRYKNTYTDKVEELEVELLVLCSAIVPSEANRELARVLGVELDENAFFKQKNLLTEPIATTKDGIFLAGCCQAPKDIPDTVAQASAAAVKASSILKDRLKCIEASGGYEKHVAHKQNVKEEEEEVTATPRVGVYVCKCGKNIAGYIDVDEIADYAKQLPNVAYATIELFACSEDALRRLKEDVEKYKLNRIVVAACSPITHAPLFQDIIAEAGLNRYLLEFANIRNQCSWVHSHERLKATEKAEALVKMAVAKALLLEPLKEYEIAVPKKALIVGAGIAGLRAALTLAKLNIHVYLVERDKELGGKLRCIYKLFPSDLDASDILSTLLKQIRRSKNIEVFTGAELVQLTGYVGNFEAEIREAENNEIKKITVGTIILATGCKEIDMSNGYSNYYYYGKHANIITQLELESKLKAGTLGAYTNIVMINCVGDLDDAKSYCCRIGCGTAIKNAKLIRQKMPDANIFILYKDMRVFGKQEEEYFADVLKSARPFLVRYDKVPSVSVENGKIEVKVYDALLQEDLVIDTDLLVLTPQLEGDKTVEALRKMLKLPTTTVGDFWLEAHAKLRPLDFAADGIYLCGSAHYPKNIADAVAQADGSSARASIPMLRGSVKAEGIVAIIDKSRCSGCSLCIALCPYNAIELVEGKPKVNEILCKGCGACSSGCLSGAIQQHGFKDYQIVSMIDYAWGATSGSKLT